MYLKKQKQNKKKELFIWVQIFLKYKNWLYFLKLIILVIHCG